MMTASRRGTHRCDNHYCDENKSEGKPQADLGYCHGCWTGWALCCQQRTKTHQKSGTTWFYAHILPGARSRDSAFLFHVSIYIDCVVPSEWSPAALHKLAASNTPYDWSWSRSVLHKANSCMMRVKWWQTVQHILGPLKRSQGMSLYLFSYMCKFLSSLFRRWHETYAFRTGSASHLGQHPQRPASKAPGLAS